MASSSILTRAMPYLGDIFVFSYPIYLLYLYFQPQDTNWRSSLWHYVENPKNKIQALSIFTTTVTGVLINYIIKLFIDQQRPFYTIDLAVNPREEMILSSIPTDAFPSDHASVGMCMALATLIIGYQDQKRPMIIMWWLFMIWSMTMNIARITMGVHWPIDILGGMIVGIISAIIIHYPVVNQFLENYLYHPIISLQETIVRCFTSKKSK